MPLFTKAETGYIDKMSNSPEPLQFLPPRMLEYVKYPFGLLAIWIALSGGILFSPLSKPDSSPSTSNADPSSSEQGQTLPQVLSLSSPENLFLERDGMRLIVRGDTPHSGESIEVTWGAEMTTVFLRSREGNLLTQAHQKVGEDRMTLEDGNGSIAYQVKFDIDECTLQTATGEKLQKIKVKEDKFNLLDANGNRVLHGKQKNGAILVRDESDNAQRTVSFPTMRPYSEQFLIAGQSSLAIPIEYRLLVLGNALLK